MTDRAIVYKVVTGGTYQSNGIVNNSAVLKHLKFIYATAFNSPAATFSL